RTPDGFAAPTLITSIGVEGATHRFSTARVRTVIADLDGDGILDVARLGEVNDGTVRDLLFVLTGDGEGGFTQSTVPAPVRGIGSVEALDLDADGILDLVASYEYALGNYAQRAAIVSLMRGDGEGGF